MGYELIVNKLFRHVTLKPPVIFMPSLLGWQVCDSEPKVATRVSFVPHELSHGVPFLTIEGACSGRMRPSARLYFFARVRSFLQREKRPRVAFTISARSGEDPAGRLANNSVRPGHPSTQTSLAIGRWTARATAFTVPVSPRSSAESEISSTWHHPVALSFRG